MTNAVGTKNMIRMQEQCRLRLIAFSISEVYGDYDGVMSEDVMDTVPIKEMNDYAMTKWVNDVQILNSAEVSNTEFVRLVRRFYGRRRLPADILALEREPLSSAHFYSARSHIRSKRYKKRLARLLEALYLQPGNLSEHMRRTLTRRLTNHVKNRKHAGGEAAPKTVGLLRGKA